METNAGYGLYAEPGDIDGDGSIDLIVSGYADNTIRVHHNMGVGVFGPAQLLVTDWYFPYSIAPGDMDNDGDLDIVAASSELDSIVWFRNDGGLFSFGGPIAQLNCARGLHLADMDGNGWLDVIGSSSCAADLMLFLNNGNGELSKGILIDGLLTYVFASHTADLNGDGIPDVLSCSPFRGLLCWYENQMMVGVEEWSPPLDGVIISPSPFHDHAAVRLSAPIGRSDVVELVDNSGRVSRSIVAKGNEFIMDGSGLAPGTYCLRIVRTDGTRTASRFVKY
ncbi:MAG: T9SS type A sorting domain-containing protein [Flavobacteriales bacterium]|nr:T9SS type A sorting domain-containing protein [Flavobacteriales bacterium]